MSSAYLITITILAIALVIVGVTWLKWHAFISLSVASLALGLTAGLPITKIVTDYEQGVGGILSSLLGILALGTILGKMMSESGAGIQISNYFTRAFGDRNLPWATFFAGLIISIPVFFEVGLVILLPLVIAIQKTTKKNLLLITREDASMHKNTLAVFARVFLCLAFKQTRLPVLPPREIDKPEFVQPVARFGILQKAGIIQINMVPDDDDMIVLAHVQILVVFLCCFFHCDFFFRKADHKAERFFKILVERDFTNISCN